MAAPVVRDAAVAMLGKKGHLVLECVRAEWPAMAEDDRLSRTPVFVVNLRAIFCRDRGHKSSSSNGDSSVPQIVRRTGNVDQAVRAGSM
jgi:hypothetical protein